MFKKAEYIDEAIIKAVTLDGYELFVPNDVNNRHRQILSEWEAEGNAIHPYESPPPPTPEEIRAAMPSLTARQFRLGLVGAGFSLAQVEAAIAAIPDDQQRAVAEIEWEYASQFERMHPLIEQVGTALGLTVEQIDGMWQAALEL